MKNTSKLKYHTNDTFKEKLLNDCSIKYNTDEVFRSKLKDYGKKQYHSKTCVQKRKKENSRQNRQNKKIKLENQEEVVNMFKKSIVRGPDFACCCCHRLLFENQVQKCDANTYSKTKISADVAAVCIQDVFLHDCTSSCSENCTKYSKWICYTCHCKIISGNIPPEAAANNMHLETVPKELSCLNSLEQHLISLHIPFMKVMALPKGGQKIFMVQWCVFPLI